MRTFSITLPNDLADSSQKIAESIGLTRAQFIRVAISHELQRVQRQAQLEAMVDSFNAMRKNKKYLKESASIEQALTTSLPEEKDEWWTGH
jgi:metal-responsive CopG/Arc/MetJ family transcriptional regulator